MPNEDSKNTNAADSHAFRDAMQDVTPLKSDKITLRSTVKRSVKRTAPQAAVVDKLSDDFIPPCDNLLEFMRPGVQRTLFKQLRTGKLPIESHIDLHGMTRDAARLGLQQFLQQAQQNHHKVVCIVHGKGYHSEDGRPVLKAMVNKWLQDLPEVLAFCSAKPQDGGSGAVYALLKNLK
jgi:DNA-nicking Smr family endonuclease